MTGKIIKGIAGFYYVNITDNEDSSNTPYTGVFECKAKGIFRNEGIKPLVGDNVELEILDAAGRKGNIVRILERKNSLVRPAVANVDQAMVIFAAAKPTPNLNLLDRFLISMEFQNVDCIICFNKSDAADGELLDKLYGIYEKSGYKVVFTSTVTDEGIDVVRKLLKGKTTVLAGPSGVGKSSITNKLIPEAGMVTGEISAKIERGRHTTRHSEIFVLDNESYVFDTPGFSSLYVNNIEKDELKKYFPEFIDYNDKCRFLGCVHINEPDCALKQAVADGRVSGSRYENYKMFYEESRNRKKY